MNTLTEGEDYYLNTEGNLVFTKKYHLKRGRCCKCGCLHCPWNYERTAEENTIKKQLR